MVLYFLWVLPHWHLKFLFKVFFSLRRWTWSHHHEFSGKLLRNSCFNRRGWKWEPRFVRQAKEDGESLYMEKTLHAYRSHCQDIGKTLPAELSIGGRRKKSEPLAGEAAGHHDVYCHPFFLCWSKCLLHGFYVFGHWDEIDPQAGRLLQFCSHVFSARDAFQSVWLYLMFHLFYYWVKSVVKEENMFNFLLDQYRFKLWMEVM